MIENSELKKHIEKEEKARTLSVAKSLTHEAVSVGGIQFIGKSVDLPNAKLLREVDTYLKSNMKNFLAVIVADINGKSAVMVSVDDEAQKNRSLNAQNIIKSIVAPLINGGGGGNPGMATAGGQDVTKLQEVINEVKNLL